MSLDKSRIPKRGNSSRKFIPEKQRKTMTDPFVDWIKRSRSDKRGTVSGRMVETRSQKTSEERRELLEVEVNRASGHRRGGECDADKNLGKNGLHAGRSDSYESPTSRFKSRSYLRSRKNTGNGPSYGRTEPLDELPGGRESGRRRPIYLGQRFCQEL